MCIRDSLEDDLMRLFGSDKLMSMFNALGVPENEQIEHKMLSSAIEKDVYKRQALYIGNGKIIHASTSKTGIIISNAYYRTPAKAVTFLN